MIDTMYLGSGDTTALLAGKETKTHISLMQRFVSGVKPYFNAYSSPIDACRTGAILEDRMLLCMDGYFSQYKVICKDMDVFHATLDFAKVEKGEVVDFIELKSIQLTDWIKFSSVEDKLKWLKSKYNNYYRQVQQQLLCTGLPYGLIRFLCVYSYDDNQNYQREIQENEYFDILIERDNEVIESIKERAFIFQQIKDYYAI